MKRSILGSLMAAFSLASVSLAALPVAAQPAGHCPPGLAKKNPPCVPPGQAKKWNLGDRYDGDWRPIDWWRYDLPRPRPDEHWIRVGDVILKVDDETRAILDIVRLTTAILGG